MSLYQQFETNPDVEKTGVILEYGFTKDKRVIAFRVARAGGANTAFNKRLEHALKPHRRLIDMQAMDPELMKQIVRRVYAETVVIGWENVQDRDGNDIPFTVENCVQIFQDLPALFDDVVAQSQRIELFRADILRLEAGN